MAMAVGAVNVVLLLALRHELPKFFSSDEAVRALTAELLPIAALIHFPDVYNQAVGALLRGTGRAWGSTFSMLIGLLVVSGPLAWTLGWPAGLGLKGVWLGLACGTWAIVFAQSVFLWRVNWNDVLVEASVNLADRTGSSIPNPSLEMEESSSSLMQDDDFNLEDDSLL